MDLANERTWVSVTPDKDDTVVVGCRWGLCNQMFASVDELENHLLDVHWVHQCSIGRLSCGVAGCKFDGESPVVLRRHVLFHSHHASLEVKGIRYLMKNEQTKQQFSCNAKSTSGCNKVFYSGNVLCCLWDDCKCTYDKASEFFQHINCHITQYREEDRVTGNYSDDERNSNEKFYPCKWEGCSKKFKRRYCLLTHVQHHSGEKQIACPFCGVFFANPTKLVDHVVRNLGTEASRLKCFLCQKTFATQRLLREHSRRHVKHYKCDFCDMTVETPSDLRGHIRNRHTTAKSFFCSFCSKGSGDLERHLTSHRSSPQFFCDKCEKVFKWKSSLDTHKKASHKKTGPLPYMCHICPKQFARGSILSKHLSCVHDIQMPSGHCKFIYKKCGDGFYRLQTERYESPELAAQLQSQQALEERKETTELFRHIFHSGYNSSSPVTASTPCLPRLRDYRRCDGEEGAESLVSDQHPPPLHRLPPPGSHLPNEQLPQGIVHLSGTELATLPEGSSIVTMLIDGEEKPVIVLPHQFQIEAL